MGRAQANALEARIAALIRDEGPVSVERYMDLCLADPEHGYYMGRDPFGPRGDFVTAPEVSQIFGELIGVWCADVWARMGRPSPFVLAELGPGRGTLMADLVRAGAVLPGFAEAARLHLVETGPALRARQRETLARAGLAARWHDGPDGLPEGPAIVVANEFFDALPVRQFELTPTGWRERAVTLGRDDRLAFGHLPEPPPPDEIPQDLRGAPAGAIVETRPAAERLIDAFAERFLQAPGALLVIDYGHVESAPGETLQAVSRHAYADVLERPGEVDLTAHVDFAALARAARRAGAAVHGPLTQGAFLSGLGLEMRAVALAKNASAAQRNDIRAAVERLAGPQAMGTLFKAMAVASADLPAPEPFAGAAP